MSCVRMSGQFLRGKNFKVEHYTQTVQPSFFIPALLIGAFDF